MTIPPLAVGLVAAGALAAEVLLTRLLAIVQWHHLAFLVVGMALLGFGASGTYLALAPGGAARPRFARHAALFAIAAPASFAIAQHVPFNALELVWDPGQIGWLGLVALLLAVPFFFAANAIGIALAAPGAPTARTYGANLVGAGAGAAGAVALLLVARAEHALFAAGALGLAGALAALAATGRRAAAVAATISLIGVAVAAALPAGWPGLELSPYKGLSGALRTIGAVRVHERSGPLGLVSAVENATVPLRHAPGLSLVATATPSAQIGLFVDGDGPSPITRFDGDPRGSAFLDAVTFALPYHLVAAPDVLVLGAGGGTAVLQALLHGARRVDAVELDPNVVGLVRGPYREFSGALYERDDVYLHAADPRGFLARTERTWSIIQVAMVEESGAGFRGLAPSHLYTVEGISALLDRLEPGGVAAFTRSARLPPRDAPRLIATAAAALRARGVAAPGDRMAMIRSLGTTTLLVGKGDLPARAVADVRRFARRWAFDLVLLPGLDPAEANVHARLARPAFFEAASALLSPEASRFIDAYKFDLRPATDDRPFFNAFVRLRHLPELLALHARGGADLVELGYLLLVASLAIGTVLGAVLIVLPLARVSRGAGSDGVSRPRVLAYFALIGLAFLMVEMALFQKLMLFLGHPLYAIALVLAGFLVFAGIGSLRAERASRDVSRRRPAAPALVRSIAVGAVLLAVLPALGDWAIGLPAPARAAVAVALMAPLAYQMGQPFPLALAALGRNAPNLVPWAWGINGCASVVSAIAATLLGIELGFTAVMAAALALYALAAWVSDFESGDSILIAGSAARIT